MTLLTMSRLRDAYRSGARTPVTVAEEVLARCAASTDPAIWIALVARETLLARAAVLAAAPKELPLYGMLEWPVASQPVVGNNLRLLQREGNGRSASDTAC